MVVSVLRILRFQQADETMPHPWPVVIEVDGPGFPEIVSGRPDAARLVGLAPVWAPTFCSILGSQLADAEQFPEAVGLVPSFLGTRGGIFALPDLTLTSVDYYEATPEQVDRLRSREADYRRALGVRS
jgi:hypothetical protein